CLTTPTFPVSIEPSRTNATFDQREEAMKYTIDPSIFADLQPATKVLNDLPSRELIVAALNSVPKIDPQTLNFPEVDLAAFQEVQRDALAVFPEWQKQLTAQLQ